MSNGEKSSLCLPLRILCSNNSWYALPVVWSSAFQKTSFSAPLVPSLKVLVEIMPVSVMIASTYLSAVLQFFCNSAAISCIVRGFCRTKSVIVSVISFVSIVQHHVHFLYS